MLESKYNEYSDKEKEEIDALIYELQLSEFLSMSNVIHHVCDGYDMYDLGDIRDFNMLWSIGMTKYGITWSLRECELRDLNSDQVHRDAKKYLIKWPDIT